MSPYFQISPDVFLNCFRKCLIAQTPLHPHVFPTDFVCLFAFVSGSRDMRLFSFPGARDTGYLVGGWEEGGEHLKDQFLFQHQNASASPDYFFFTLHKKGSS